MPRPPRRTAAARRVEQKTAATTTTKPARADSPAPSATRVPSSPPVSHVQPSDLTKSASTLSIESDVEVVPATQPLTHGGNTNKTNNVPQSSGRVSRNTIMRANEAASTISKQLPATIEVSRTPSPTIRRTDVVSMSTPPFETRGRKRDSKTAFEEDFAASLMAAEDGSEDDAVLPDTPTKSSGGPSRKRLSTEASKLTGSAVCYIDYPDHMTNEVKATQVLNADETIDFNYSSSPERSPAPKRFGFLQPLEDSDSESEEEEEHDENENRQEDVEREEAAAVRPRRNRAPSEKPQQLADPKHPTTKSLQSLLPKRRTKPTKKLSSKSKSKITKESKGKAPSRSRAALGDVTKDVLDEDELQAIDAPARPMFGAGMDILSDDELGREIYVDSSARSSSLGAPPTPPSPPRRIGRGAKGKGRAASADPEAGRRPPRKSYGKPRRQDSEVSNKENDTPLKVRAGKNLLSRGGRFVDATEVQLSKNEKKEVDAIRRKFREVDDWDLCFEEVAPSSSDGIVQGAR
ncbi:hypothetical protein ABW20_dc0106842 [Dactylellina cionopaga]|nr:hypothetical protein ABW20_dc0106842 [Dactylellina cionopaga]